MRDHRTHFPAWKQIADELVPTATVRRMLSVVFRNAAGPDAWKARPGWLSHRVLGYQRVGWDIPKDSPAIMLRFSAKGQLADPLIKGNGHGSGNQPDQILRLR